MKVTIKTKLIHSIVCVVSVCYFNNAIAQPALQWQNCRGGVGSVIGYFISNTTDSGFVMCGITNVNNGEVSGFHSSVNGYSDG